MGFKIGLPKVGAFSYASAMLKIQVEVGLNTHREEEEKKIKHFLQGSN